MTASVIDSLLVELKLDKKSYDTGYLAAYKEQKKFVEATQAGNKQVVASNKAVENSFHSLKLEAAAAIAIFFGATGIKEWIANLTTGQAALGRLSQNLNISAARLDAWGTVAEEMGDKASDTLGALQTVASGIAEATIKGHSALTDVARANGVSLVDARGKLLGNEDILLRFSARMQQLPRQQAIALANMAGLGGISNELLLGPEELSRRLRAAEQLSRATADSTKRAQELEKSWADLMRRFHGIQEEIFSRLEPTLERVGNKLAAWVERVDWDRLIDRVAAFGKSVDDVVQKFGGWQTVAIALGGVLTLQLLKPLAGVVGLIARLATLGGAGTVVSGLSTAFGSLATALAGINLAAVATVVGAAAAFYSPNTGGVNKKGEQVEDLTDPNAKGARVGTSNADLWNTVLGKPSNYQGGKSQAISLLARRVNVDQVSDDDYQRTMALIWQGKIRPGNGTAGNAEPEPVSAPPSPGAARVSQDPALNAYFGQLEGQYGLPPGLLDRVWAKESSRGANTRTSPKGAKGPFQFTDETAADYGLSPADVKDPRKAGAAAAHYLADLRTQFGGDLTMALAAYNWGPGNLKRQGLANAPAETQDYITLARGLQLGPQGPGAAPVTNQAGNTATTDVHIGQLTVNTAATDARGIARDLGREIRQQGLVYPFNQGVE